MNQLPTQPSQQAITRSLPKLADLHQDPQTAFKNDQLKTLLNQPPSENWIKKHPMAKVKNDQGQNVPSRYLPIDKMEFLLDVVFQQWKVEVLSAQVMFNAIAVTIRLHYLNPVSGEWMYHDGVGAANVQTDAGQTAANLGAIKAAAVQMALPSAKSYAIKDAAEHLGAIFGRNLNRRDTVMFAGVYSNESETIPAQPQTAPIQQQATAAQPQPQQPSAQPVNNFQFNPNFL